jgi:hypothetical protein
VALPAPEPGLVLNYAYLWHHEYGAGEEEGRKHRPSVIVLCSAKASDDALIVTVLPVTHTPPADEAAAIEIPAAVKKHLRLDDARSWIVVAEGNEFVWPGYDLRQAPKSKKYDSGFLPPHLFDRVRNAFIAWHGHGPATIVRRS